MTYDGYGRLKTRHVPEQDVGTATVWDYYADDTVQQITDARGASQNITYNARHLPTAISYTVPPASGIENAASVSFAYDSAGNRTSMTDGLGSVSYSYNQLSQLTSEARTFTGVGSFTLSYAYNLAGALTSLTDPFGAQVGYSYDTAGRTSAITGSGFAGVSNYLTNVQYRAWGALKAGSYGNSKSVAVTYDNALRPAIYEVPGIIKKSYQYYADGSSKFVQDQLTTNSKFDRSYSYDHAGRVTTALSGAEARGGGPTDDRPYKESLTYDAMNNLTARTLRHWNRDQNTGPDTFTNNRKSYFGWSYDADGRLKTSSSGSYYYDAAGRTYSFGDPALELTDQSFDGLGRKASYLKRHADEEGQWVTDENVYFVVSTLLSGAVLSEVSATGAKVRTFVYAGAETVALQQMGETGPEVYWRHLDPNGISSRTTNSAGQWTGAWSGAAELDPLGADTGTFKPLTWPPPASSAKLVPYRQMPDINSVTGGCTLDYVPIPCEIFQSLNASGSVAEEYLDILENNPRRGRGIRPAVRDRKPRGPWYYFIEVPVGWDDVSWAGRLIPQNTNLRTREQDALSRARQMLTGRCADFMNRVLRRAAEMTNQLTSISLPTGTQYSFNADSGLIAYQGALNRNEVRSLDERRAVDPNFRMPSRAEGLTTTSHTRFSGMFVSRIVTWRGSFYHLRIEDAARQTLHESSHQFEGFTDAVLANAGRYASNERPERYGESESEIGRASDDFNRLIRQHCP
jgi:YD repeat-containing protein